MTAALSVVLVNAPSTVRQDVAPARKSGHAPLGLISLGTSLAASGIDVHLFDLWGASSSLGGLLDHVAATQPTSVGINVCSPNLPAALSIAGLVRDVAPLSLVVAGGPHASAAPQTLAYAGSPFTHVVVGEGEHVFASLIRERAGRRAPIAATTTVVSSSASVELDDLPPPDFSLMGRAWLDQHPLEIPLLGSRGCPYRCAYCAIAATLGSRLRVKPATMLAAEIRSYVDTCGPTGFKFVSEDFRTRDGETLSHRIEAIGAAVDGRPWRCQLRADKIDPELAQVFADNGCVDVLFGVDAVTDRAQAMAGRRIDLARVRKLNRAFAGTGISTQAVFILGLPGETSSEAAAILRYAATLRDEGASQLTFFPLLPFPGSRIWREYYPACRFGGLPISVAEAHSVGLTSSYFTNYSLIPEPTPETTPTSIARLLRRVDVANTWGGDPSADGAALLDDSSRHSDDVSSLADLVTSMQLQALEELRLAHAWGH